MITLQDVTFAYDAALSGFTLGPVTLTLKPGLVYGWRGPNGSGKSTLAAVISGRRKPSAGVIIGRPRRILHFQQTVGANIFPDLTVHDHLALAATARQREFILTRFPTLQKHLHEYPDRLSGGQLQRLAFSLSLLTEFDAYIFDEVTNHLDSDTVVIVGETFRRLAAAHPERYYVFISHDREFLQTYCDTTIAFDEGRVVSATPGAPSDKNAQGTFHAHA